jgi:hypothetical protein
LGVLLSVPSAGQDCKYIPTSLEEIFRQQAVTAADVIELTIFGIEDLKKKGFALDSEDVVINQNDVLFIPGSTTKTMGKGVLNSISSIPIAVVYVGAR